MARHKNLFHVKLSPEQLPTDLFHVKLLRRESVVFSMSHVNFLRSASKPATFKRVADEKPFFVSRETFAESHSANYQIRLRATAKYSQSSTGSQVFCEKHRKIGGGRGACKAFVVAASVLFHVKQEKTAGFGGLFLFNAFF